MHFRNGDPSINAFAVFIFGKRGNEGSMLAAE